MIASARVARILVCEDSPTYALALKAFLEHDSDLRVVGVCRTGEQLLRRLPLVRPDLVTMDLELPGIDGREATERIMSSAAVPVIVLSDHARRGSERAAAALAAGALDAIPKSELTLAEVEAAASVALRRKVKRLANATLRAQNGNHREAARAVTLAGRRASVIGICASTGGPQAIHHLLRELPGDFPVPILVVQHMADGFLDGFVEWLDRAVALPVRVASEGERPRPGVSFAPDGAHLVLDTSGRFAFDHRDAGPHVPSGDVLFDSLARRRGPEAVGVVLTGLGRDGAEGVRALGDAGGVAITQDADSSAVFGMPQAAVDSGTAIVLPPAGIGILLSKLRPGAEG
jgi:two-component system chemotaxis response regulator CheB